MNGMEKILLLYINPEHIEMEITTSYNDTLKDLAFKKKSISFSWKLKAGKRCSVPWYKN